MDIDDHYKKAWLIKSILPFLKLSSCINYRVTSTNQDMKISIIEGVLDFLSHQDNICDYFLTIN